MNDEKRRELLAKLNLHLANGTRVSDELKAEIEAVLKEDVEGWKVETMIEALKEWGGEGQKRPEFETRLNKAKLDELLVYLEEYEELRAEERERIAEIVARMVESGNNKTTVEELIARLRELRELDREVAKELELRRNADLRKDVEENVVEAAGAKRRQVEEVVRIIGELQESRQPDGEVPQWSREQTERISRRVSMEVAMGRKTEEVMKAPELKTNMEIWRAAEEWVEKRMGESGGNLKLKEVVAERIIRTVRSNDYRLGDLVEGKSLAMELEENGLMKVKGGEMNELETVAEKLATEETSLEVRRKMIEREVIVAMARENPKATVNEVVAWGKTVADLSVGNKEIESEARGISRQGSQGVEVVEKAKTIVNILSGKTSVGKLLESVNQKLRMPLEIRELRVVSGIMTELRLSSVTARLMEASRRMMMFEEVTRRFEGTVLAKIGGWIGSDSFERIAKEFTSSAVAKEILMNSILILSRDKMTTGMGLKLIGSALLEGGSKKLAEVAVIKAGEAVASKGIWTFLAGIMASGLPPAWLVTGAMFVGNKAAELISGAFGGIRQGLASLGIKIPVVSQITDLVSSMSDWLGEKIPVLGSVIKEVGKLVNNLINATVDVATAAVVVAVVGVFAFIFLLSNLINNPFFASIKPYVGGEINELAEVFLVPEIDPKIVLPESCPEGWPVKTGIGMRITRGPGGGDSHKNGLQAVDLSNKYPGAEIFSTHDGVAVKGRNSGYGYYVDLYATCDGQRYMTRYAHMPAHIRSLSKKYTEVKAGVKIGNIDNSGNSSGAHLHYELRGLGSINRRLPITVPDGCDGVENCGGIVL